MPKTLKQLLDQVNDEAGFEKPTSYVGSDDPNIAQLVAIANRSAIILRDMGLQKLLRVATISLTGGTSVPYSDMVFSYPLPADFLSLVPDTTYQIGRIDQADFPTTPELWNYMISRSGPAGLRVRSPCSPSRRSTRICAGCSATTGGSSGSTISHRPSTGTWTQRRRTGFAA